MEVVDLLIKILVAEIQFHRNPSSFFIVEFKQLKNILMSKLKSLVSIMK